MAFPAVWATLLLDADTDVAKLASQFQSLGVGAFVTQEGWLSLDGGFLARLSTGPYPTDRLHHPATEDAPKREARATLDVSGGGHETDRLLFREHTKRRSADGSVPSKSSRFLKVEALAALLSRLSSLGEGVVLPEAAHRFVRFADWPSGGAGQVFGAFVTLGLTERLLVSRGMRVFGVPDVGIGRNSGDTGMLSRSMFDAAFEIAWQGFVPDGSTTLHAFVDPATGPWNLALVAQDALWLGGTGEDAVEFAFRANVATILGTPYLFDDREGGGPDVAVFANTERAFMTTVGLHRNLRSDGRIELTATSPRLSRSAGFALHELGKLLLASGESVKAYHRVALPALEAVGIGGAVLWPAGNVGLGREGLSVATWDALPVTPQELEQFRAGGQEAWMDAIEANNAFSQLHARWCARPLGA